MFSVIYSRRKPSFEGESDGGQGSLPAPSGRSLACPSFHTTPTNPAYRRVPLFNAIARGYLSRSRCTDAVHRGSNDHRHEAPHELHIREQWQIG